MARVGLSGVAHCGYCRYMPPTPVRNIRVPDELWDRVKHKAWIERTDVTAVIVAYLETYAADIDPTLIPEVPDHV